MDTKDKLVTLEGAELLYNSVKDDIEDINDSLSTLDSQKIGYAYTDGEYLILKSSESSQEEIARLTGFGGGGGGGGPSYMFRVTNTTGFLDATRKEGSEIVLSFNWSSKYDGTNTGDGEVNVTFKNLPNEKIRQSITQTNDGGNVSINVSKYMILGRNEVTVSVIDSYYQKRELNFSINIVSLEIRSNFVDTIVYPIDSSNNVLFPYSTSYSGEKVVHFILDGTEIATRSVTTTSETTETLTGLTHGAHELEVYYTAVVNDVPVNSKNTLRYDIMYAVSGNTTPIISCPFDNTTVTQYDNVSIPYMVYTNGQETSHVSLYIKGPDSETFTLVNELDVKLTRQIWTYRAETPGSFTFRIESGTVYKEFTITVRESDIEISPHEGNLVLHLNPYQRDNSNEETRGTWTQVWDQGQWVDTNVNPVFTGFNWKSDGWIKDSNNIDVLRLHSLAKVEIPFDPFDPDNATAIGTTGMTIELEFATSSVMDFNSPIISCMNEGIGFEITSQEARLSGAGESVGTPFKEDEHIRISFVITRQVPEHMIYIYINGILSGAQRYSGSFAHLQSTGITLGSQFSTLDLYHIRVYNVSLTHKDIVDNWIADMQDSEQMMTEYFNKLIYDKDSGEVSLANISNLPIGLPYLVLETTRLSETKTDKVFTDGYYVNPKDSSRNFTFENAVLSVQGTSSADYPRKNYKLKFENGLTMNNGEQKSKYALREGSIPVKTICLKADYASSEGANNVELVRYYCDICPVKTPPQTYDENDTDEEKAAKDKIRQGIDGFPIVVFWDDKPQEPNNQLKFLGKYNFNNDKGTSEVYGFYADDNVRDQSWETKNNDTDKALWKDDNYTDYDSWKSAFESRFPDYGDNEGTDADISDLAALASWIKSTDTNNVINSVLNEETGETTYSDTGIPIWAVEDKTTYDEDNNPIYHGETLSPPVPINGVEYEEDNEEYRLAKFKSEIENYFDLQDTLFYYLFTEVFLMVDSRVKNSFPTRYDSHPGAKWMWLPYDMDTAIGINNEGQYSFHYYSEDIDWENDSMVYNGQHSALWPNVRKCFFNEIKQMYHDLRTGDKVLSYEEIEKRFEDHQKMWPAAIYNEDAYQKYIVPVVDEGADKAYLNMCLGSKAEQRKWWLYNRFKYLDSKYEVGDSATKKITFRAYQPGSFTLTPYSDVYLKVEASHIGSDVVRGKKGIASSVPISFGSANDSVVNIFSADLLMDVGDLSQLRPGFCSISDAVKLQRLKIGGETRNTLFNSLTLGNNTLLTYIDVRNCPNLRGIIDAKGCLSLQTVLFEGTSISGIELPDGGIVETLHLPSTITTLEILNQPYISDFQIESYSNIVELNLENAGAAQSNALNILMQLKSGSFVRITGLDLEFEGGSDIKAFLNKTTTLRGGYRDDSRILVTRDYPYLSGTAHIKNATLQQVETLTNYGLTVTYDYFVMYVEFYDELGREKLGETMTHTNSVSYSGQPRTKTSDAQYTYSFGGWSRVPGGDPEPGILNNITDSCSLYMAYNKLIRSYEISFYNESELLLRKLFLYGSMPEYTGDIPQYKGVDPLNYGEFIGWAPEIHAVNGTANYYATFRYTGVYTFNYLMKEAASVESTAVTQITPYAFYNHNKLRTASFEGVTRIGEYAFNGCNLLSELIVPNVEYIGESALSSTGIYSLNFPKVEQCFGINTNKEILDFDFPNLKILRNSGFYGGGNTTITSISFPKLTDFINSSDYGTPIINGFKNLNDLQLPLLRRVSSISFGSTEMTYFTKASLPSIRTLGAFGTNNPLEVVDFGPDLQSLPQQTSSYYSSSNKFNSGLKSLILRAKRFMPLTYSVNHEYSPFRYCYSTVTIYVDPSLVDKYRNATNWSVMSERIKPIYEVTAASTLEVTANNVSGRYSTTTLHVHAVGSGTYLGADQTGTMTLDFDCISPDFGINPGEDDRTVEVEYTYGGRTVRVPVAQTGCKPNTLVIDTTRNIINTSSYVYDQNISTIVNGNYVTKSASQLFTRGFERAENQPYDDFIMYVSTNGYTAVSSDEMNLCGTRLDLDKEILIPTTIAKFRFFGMTDYPTFKTKAFYGLYSNRYYNTSYSTVVCREENFRGWTYNMDGGSGIITLGSSDHNQLDPEVDVLTSGGGWATFTESVEMDHTYSVKIKDCYGIENSEGSEIDRATYFLFPDRYNIEFREVRPTT